MSFASLGLSEALVRAIEAAGYTEPTPVQQRAIPAVLQGRDLMVAAQTGTGKTGGFALPILERLFPNGHPDKSQRHGPRQPRVLVLTPTRELAAQVHESFKVYARDLKFVSACIFGGVGMNPQVQAMSRGVDVLVACPGRLLDLAGQGSVDLSHVEILVLDEADRMLDMGFYDDIAFVAKACPKERQTLLFSATFPEGIATLARAFLRDPKQVTLPEQHESSKIRQRFYEVTNDQRLAAVALLLKHYRPVSTLAFCNTRQQCRDLLQVLRTEGFVALALHGEMEQRERDQVLIQFANRSCSVLVATDVAARGLDIDQLEAVINVDITPDSEIHVHRIGRTGRVDQDGWAFSLVSSNQKGRVANIVKTMGIDIEWRSLNDLQTPADTGQPLMPPMVTLLILGGRKEKIRPGDVLGALTGEAGFSKEQVGKINVTDTSTYVAVERSIAKDALRKLSAGTIKGKKVKVHLLSDKGG